MYEIEKGIPIPVKRGEIARYPLRTMNVGDSFVISVKERSAVSTRAHDMKRLYGLCFTVRRVVENGITQYRVWRTK